MLSQIAIVWLTTGTNSSSLGRPPPYSVSTSRCSPRASVRTHVAPTGCLRAAPAPSSSSAHKFPLGTPTSVQRQRNATGEPVLYACPARDLPRSRPEHGACSKKAADHAASAEHKPRLGLEWRAPTRPQFRRAAAARAPPPEDKCTLGRALGEVGECWVTILEPRQRPRLGAADVRALQGRPGPCGLPRTELWSVRCHFWRPGEIGEGAACLSATFEPSGGTRSCSLRHALEKRALLAVRHRFFCILGARQASGLSWPAPAAQRKGEIKIALAAPGMIDPAPFSNPRCAGAGCSSNSTVV